MAERIRQLERELAEWTAENRLLDAAIAGAGDEASPAVLAADAQRALEDELLARHEQLRALRLEHDGLRAELALKQTEARALAGELAAYDEARRRAAVEAAALQVALEESLLLIDVSQASKRQHEQLRGVRELAARAAPGAPAAGGRAEPNLLRTAADADLVHRAHLASFGLRALRERAASVRGDVESLERGVGRARARAWVEDRTALRAARARAHAVLERVADEAARLSPMAEHCLPLLARAADGADELGVVAHAAVAAFGRLREARRAQGVRRLRARAARCQALLDTLRVEQLAAAAAGRDAHDARAQALLVDVELRAEVSRLRDLTAIVHEEERQLQRVGRYVRLCDAHVGAIALEPRAAERGALLEREEAAAANYLVSAERRQRDVRNVARSRTEEDLGSAKAAISERRDQVAHVAAAVAELRDEARAVLELASSSHLRAPALASDDR